MKVTIVNEFSASMLPVHEVFDLMRVGFQSLGSAEAARGWLLPLIMERVLLDGDNSCVADMIRHPDLSRVVGMDLNINAGIRPGKVQLNTDTMLLLAQYIGPELPEGATTLPEGATLEYFVVSLKEPPRH